MTRRELVVEMRPGVGPLYVPGKGALRLPGAAGSYASTPDAAALDITGDIDVRIEVSARRWSGNDTTTDDNILAGKYLTTGNQRSWLLEITETGQLVFQWSNDGTAILGATSTDMPYVPTGGRIALRATLDVNNGAAGKTVTFYTATSIDGTWVPLGSPVTTAGTTAVFASTAALEVGSTGGGAAIGSFDGDIYAFELRDGIDGTVVADPDFTGRTAGTTSFADAAGRTWTLHGDAEITEGSDIAWITLSAGGPHGNRVHSVQWEIGRDRDDDDWPPGEATVQLFNHDRLFDPDNSSGTYFGRLLPRVPFRLTAPGTDSALVLPGPTTRLVLASADTAETPSNFALGITGDIDVRAYVAADDWTPGGFGASAVARWGTSELSWLLGLDAAGPLSFVWSPDGVDEVGVASTLTPGFTDGSAHWIRATLDVDNGNGDHVTRFWVSDDGETWLPLGAPVVGSGVTSVYRGANPLTVGDLATGGLPMPGDYYYAEVRDGIDGPIVAAVDFRDQAPGVTSFDDGGNTWTLGGTAALQQVPGTGGYASTPDAAALDITGDIDIRIDVTLEDWRPTTDIALASKYLTTGNQRSWLLYLNDDGTVSLRHSANGTATITATSTAAVTPGPGGRKAIRATLDVDNGAAGHTVTFYTAENIDGTWTALGAAVTTAGTTSVFSSSAEVDLGAFDAGAPTGMAPLTGDIHGFELRNGIGGTAVANPDFAAQTAGATSFADAAGRTWTVEDEATIALDPAQTGDQFYGSVQYGWEQDPRPPADGICVVRLVDLLGVLPGMRLPGVFEAAVLAAGPTGYWRLDDSSGFAADQGSAGLDGDPSQGVNFGEDPLLPALGASTSFDGDASVISVSRSPLFPDTFRASVVAVFRTPIPAEAASIHPLFQVASGGNASANDAFTLYVGTTGLLKLDGQSVAAGGGSTIEGPAVDDDDAHLAFAQWNLGGASVNEGVAVDQPVLDNTSGTGFFQGGNGTAVGGTPEAAGNFTDNQFDGFLSHVAAFDRPLGQADRDAIHGALAALAGRRSDEQIRWALDQLGVPDEYMDLDEGRAVMGPAETQGMDVLDFVRRVAATERGAFYVDHRNGGRLRFRERYFPWLHQRATIDQVTFSDDPAATGVVRVEADALEIEPNGVNTVVNQWTVTWIGSEETVRDQGSIDAYGLRGDTIETQAPTPAVARGLAQFELAQTKDPRTLVHGLGIDAGAAEDGFPAAVGLRIGDRASYRSQPQATGSVDTRSLQIEGIGCEARGKQWRAELHTSEAPSAHLNLFLIASTTSDPGGSLLDGDDVLAP